ncbi:natural cytotoxicity triggering receptor 3 ligand 1 isoform X2 [Macrotis lagotis]|uniref:natural cytotoxicity triggering receptor 3 ligand 1 isoform X2 n=1 Tax=Macrotis lagotis TaxID=92651 RepID=UPI003D69531B
MANGGGPFLAAAVIFLGLLLSLWGPRDASDSLQAKMDGKIQVVSLGGNVIIFCEFSSSDILPLDIRDIEIRWFLRSLNSDKEIKVFELYRGHQTAFRPGAKISMSRRRWGDASLYLSHIQIQERGEYRCEVIQFPRRAQGTIILDVVEHGNYAIFSGLIITVILFVLVGVIWFLHFRKVKPMLFLSLEPEYLIHKELKEFSFAISGF